LRLFVLLACLLALPATSAEAVTEPPQLVAGANSKWISGDLLQQTGLNCSTAILGSAYTEVMVAGNASYGGAPNGGVPKVNDPYWTAFLISIPGNPCGTGSSSVVTTLILPPNTQVDSTRQVKCYGLPRNATDTTPWQDLTNASWNFLGQSGPYCAAQPSISPYHQGGLQFGFRPLANGQMFWIFVPVKSSAPLIGAGGPSPGHGFTWMTDATGVYANPGRSFVWANVLASGTPTSPFIYFPRDPVPFWKNDAAEGLRNRVEFFTNLYSAFKPGNLCFAVYAGPTATGAPLANCTTAGFTQGISNQYDLWQVFGTGESLGPNGGYVPFAYDNDTTYTMRWTFTPTDGSAPAVKDQTFRTLSGPDQDGDGVPNNGADACPNVKGTLANGCLPAVQEDPDKDGVYGAADNCPQQDGQGALNGCPGGIVPPPGPGPGPGPGPEPKVLVGIVQVKKGAVFKRAALAKGAPVKFTCTVDSAAAGALSIAAKVAKKLGIKPKRGQKNVVIASGKGRCDDASGGSLKLKLLRAVARKVKAARRGFPASLSVKLTASGQTPVTMKRGVNVR
jgi:hypothetical protein